MTDRRRLAGQCQAQTRFAHKADAVAVVDRMNRNGGKATTYRCEVCKAWHIGYPNKTSK